MLKLAKGAATIMQANPMRKIVPRECLDFLNVMQELNKLVGALPDRYDVFSPLDRIKVVAHVMHTASRRGNDKVESREITDEERLSVGAVSVEPAVCHRLAATRLVARINDVIAGRTATFHSTGQASI